MPNEEFTHISLTYFKDSGKYYSSDEIDIPKCMFHEAITHVKDLVLAGKWPGLTAGSHTFDILVRVYTEYGPLHWLIVHPSHRR